MLACRYPTPCPNGTYSPLPTGVTLSGVLTFGCLTCSGGYYCREGSAGMTQCREGFYCPAGSSDPIPCPLAHTCPLGSATFIPCEEGYYCPEGTGSIGIPCPVGNYCPEASAEPIPCPLGTADADPQVRSDEANTCELCPPGTAGADEARAVCLPCEAGHVCSGPGTTNTTPTDLATQLGYVCPPGHYCAASSVLEVPCPVGTFSDVVGATSIDTCTDCDVNHYNNRVGETVCRQCGGTSVANASSATCTCVGKNRVFQSTQGMCRCKPRFIDTDEASTMDGLGDCFPIPIAPNCPDGEIRDTNEYCVSIEESCAEECVHGGRRQPSGLCACDQVQSAADVCGDGTTDCIDDLPEYHLDKHGALHIVVDGVDINMTDELLRRFENPDQFMLFGKT